MSDFQLLYTFDSVDRDVTGYSRNVTGAPLLSATKITAEDPGDASPIAGVYRFRFETTTTVSVRVVNFQDSSNPLIYAGNRTVVADYLTENLNLIPGWALVFRGDAQVGDEFELGIGCYLNGTQWVRITSFGPRLVGTVSASRTLKAKNISAGVLTNCVAVATNAIRVENDQAGDRPFAGFVQTGILSPESDTDLDGTAVTFDNLDSGTVDLLVDGESIGIYDVAAETLMPGGVGLSCDGTTVYRFADGTKYQSGTFILSSSLQETDTATLYVSDGGVGTWLSDDGDSFVPGVHGIELADDTPTTYDGLIDADGEVEFQIRIGPESAETVDLNERSFSLRLVGLDDSDEEQNLEHQGSYIVVQGDAQLLLRITATEEAYGRPRFSEDPENPGEYVEDDEGEYVENLSDPGHYIHYTADPNGGNYGNYLDYLAANGVTFVDT